MKKIKIAPPNSMFFLEDPQGGKSPAIDERSSRIWSTKSCIIVGCQAFVDGETEFFASTSEHDILPAEPAFDGMLETPSLIVEISTSERQILLRCEIQRHLTRVRIWTNDPSLPDHILAVFT